MEASALQAPVAIRRFSVSAPLLRLRSDEQLVALFRAGSEDAFRVIHDRYHARLFIYTRQMLSGRQDAEDALQDVFFRAYGALRASNRPISLRAWLYRVAHNRCIDQLRRPAPRPGDVFEAARLPQADPAAQIESREQLRRLVLDVSRLPAQQRSALLMRELQGMTYEELSQAMDVSVAAVKSLLVRARGGLVDAAEARDATCGSIRVDLALACDRGVRASSLARRHLRDCSGCREYRDGLRGVRRNIAGLLPVGPLGLLANALGLGGTGAAAGGAAGGVACMSGAGAVATVTKAALVCAAALTAGGALDAAQHAVLPAPNRTPAHAAKPVARAPEPSSAAAPAVASAISVSPQAASARVDLAPHAAWQMQILRPAHPRRHHHQRSDPLTGQDVLPAATSAPQQQSTNPSGSALPASSAPLTAAGGAVGSAVTGANGASGSSTGSSGSGTSGSTSAATGSGPSGTGSTPSPGTTSSGSTSGSTASTSGSTSTSGGSGTTSTSSSTGSTSTSSTQGSGATATTASTGTQ